VNFNENERQKCIFLFQKIQNDKAINTLYDPYFYFFGVSIMSWQSYGS